MKAIIQTFFILLFSFSLISFASAQEEQVMQTDVYTNPFAMGNQQLINNFKNSGSKKGDVSFYFEKWIPMKVVTIDSQMLRAKKANFYIPLNKLVFEKDGGVLELYPEKIKEVRIGDAIFKSFPVKVEAVKSRRTEFVKMAFFEVIFDGEKMKLLRSVELKKTRPPSQNPLGIVVNQDFVTKQKEKLHIYRKDDTSVIELTKSKKKFAKLFGKDRKAVIKFASKNDLSHKSKKDIKAILSYYEIYN